MQHVRERYRQTEALRHGPCSLTVFHTEGWTQRSSMSLALSDGVLAIHTDSL